MREDITHPCIPANDGVGLVRATGLGAALVLVAMGAAPQGTATSAVLITQKMGMYCTPSVHYRTTSVVSDQTMRLK